MCLNSMTMHHCTTPQLKYTQMCAINSAPNKTHHAQTHPPSQNREVLNPGVVLSTCNKKQQHTLAVEAFTNLLCELHKIMQSLAHQNVMAHISGNAILKQSTPCQHTPNTIKIKQGCPNCGVAVSTNNTKYQNITML